MTETLEQIAKPEKKKWDWEKELQENEYMSPTHRKIIMRLHDPNFKPFRIDPSFVAKYARKQPAFGFNGLGEVTYLRTYSRIREDGRERWHDTIKRVVEGTFNLQKRYAKEHGLRWDDYQAKEHAEEMFDRMFNFKFTPPGRGLWAMGTEITEERGLYAALNNCAFVSTDRLNDLELGYSKPFEFLMDMSMLGVGVGFDTKGAGKLIIKGPDSKREVEKFVIPDTREGWVKSTGALLNSYFMGTPRIEFDYSKVRGKGEEISGFGGVSAGREPLTELHNSLEDLLERRLGWPITSGDIVDVQNMIGRAVVAGNVRRSAEIAFGLPGDEEFLDLKNPDLYKAELESHRWASNNSILAYLGMDYSEIAERIKKNGEPGLLWLENVKHYGRMRDPRGEWDIRAEGANPCVEQSLESYEICDLVETYPANHESLEDFKRTLKFAYMYAKTVTLGESHWEETNRVVQRNRRIGTSMSGIQQHIAKVGLHEAIKWWNEGAATIDYYDKKYSDEWFGVRRSIKRTSIKPSGTVSLLVGATPGMHWVTGGEYAIRRQLFAKNDPIVEILREKGYHLEDSVYDKYSVAVSFPLHIPGVREERQVSMWEQLEMAALIQYHWADNQVSCTVKFDREKEGDQIIHALNHFQYRLKGISLLPHDHGYKQPPYEPISKEQYFEMTRRIKPLDDSIYATTNDAVGEKGCNNDSCLIPIGK